MQYFYIALLKTKCDENKNYFNIISALKHVTINKNLVQQIEFNIYPSPGQACINIDVPAAFVSTKFDVLDYVGNAVLSNCVKQNNDRTDLSNLSNGVYFIKFQSNKIPPGKIVKQ